MNLRKVSYKLRVKKMLSFLASSTFFKYVQIEGFAFKKFKMFMGAYPQTP